VGELAPEIEEEYLIWRIWSSKKVPLQELRQEWTYKDLLKANAILDYEETYELAADGLQPEA
jgi:hypothetical protein